MTCLTTPITVTLGMALLTLLSHSPTGAQALTSKMFDSTDLKECAECFETNLPACGKMRRNDIKYATCVCGGTFAESLSLVIALLPCADICATREDPLVDNTPYVVMDSLMSYCDESLPASFCKDPEEMLKTVGGIWSANCHDRTNIHNTHGFPTPTTGIDVGSALMTAELSTGTHEAMPTLTGNKAITQVASTQLAVTMTDAGNTQPTSPPSEGPPQPSPSTAGGAMGNRVETWGAVAVLGAVAALV